MCVCVGSDGEEVRDVIQGIWGEYVAYLNKNMDSSRFIIMYISACILVQYMTGQTKTACHRYSAVVVTLNIFYFQRSIGW